MPPRMAREEVFRRLWDPVPAIRTWDPKYDEDARFLLKFAIGRVDGVMARDRTLDCSLVFERVPLSSMAFGKANAPSRDAPDGGYPMLREMLSRFPDRDSIPVCGATLSGVSGYVLWDGRHRYKTYLAAGRSEMPSWTARFSRGSGVLTVGSNAGAPETESSSPT